MVENYVFDPSAGIICTKCMVAVRKRESRSYRLSIGFHEDTISHKRSDSCCKSSNKDLNKIVIEFTKYIKDCVTSIRNCLPSIDVANKKFLSYVGEPDLYTYCSSCGEFFDEMALSTCFCDVTKVKKYGVKSKYWTNRKPIVIDMEFDLTNENHMNQYACDLFREVWNSNINTDISIGPNLVVDERASKLFAMLQRQALVYAEGGEQIVVEPIDNTMTPNLYVTSLMWDDALKGCKLNVIDSMKHADRFGDYEEAELLGRFDGALWYGLNLAKLISGSHPILYTLGTKDGGTTDRQLNLKFKMESWSKYFLHIKRICLLIFRLQNTNNSFHDHTLPKVVFTKHQLDLLQQCLANQEEDTDKSHQLHLNFLLSLIDQSIGDRSYECPIIAAVAIMSIKKSSFISARLLSPVIAGVITTYRMLLVYKCYVEREAIADTLDEEKYDEYLQTIAIEYAVKYLYINDKSNLSNPMRELIKALMIVINEAKSLDGEEKLMWSTDMETVTYVPSGFDFPMSLYPTCSNAAVAQAKSMLLKMLGYDTLPTIPWKTIHDDPRNNDYNYSFLSDLQNHKWIKSKYYQQQILASKSKWWDNGSIDKGAVDAFAKLVDRFRLILLPLIHVTAGMPPRGTEVTNLTFANTAQSIRNIFIECGCVHIRTLYHKTMVHTKNYKPISRYLHNCVGELLVYYLWLVLPFWQLVLGSQNEATKYSQFLLSNDIVLKNVTKDTIWNTSTLSNCLKSFFSKENVNVQSYRQIAKGVFEEKLHYFIDDDEEDDSEDRLFDLQAAHTTHTAKKNYAITATLSRNYKHFYDLSCGWHDFVFDTGTGTGMGTGTGSTGSTGRVSNSRGIGVGTSNAGITLCVADAIADANADFDTVANSLAVVDSVAVADTFETDIFNAFNVAADSNFHNDDNGVAIFEESDSVFQEDTWIDMEMSVHDAGIRHPEVNELNALTNFMTVNPWHERCIQRRLKQMETSEGAMLCMLKMIVKDPNASFRGNQLSTIACIVRYESACIVQICGTGIGKSLSFIIPARLADGGVSIVITPLLALQADHIKGAINGGITGNNAVIWQETETTDDLAYHPALIFITPEGFMKRSFQSYLNKLKAFHLLDRIVVDECHLILEATNNFRPEMKDMVHLIKKTAVQVVLLTATLPFIKGRNVEALLDKFKYTINDEAVVVFCDPTIRTNLQYVVENVHNTDHMNMTISSYIQQHLGEVTIIYVPYKDSGVEVQLYLENIYPGNEFHFYHSKANGKEEMLVDWMSSTMKVIIATTALGCGLNVLNVRLVIHAGAPFSLTDFVQGSGRAGRDGLDSYSLMIHNLTKKLSPAMEQQHSSNGMGEYLHTSGCRRAVIDKYIDGNETRVNGCGIGESPCDNCCRCKSVDCDTKEALDNDNVVGHRMITPTVDAIPLTVLAAPEVSGSPIVSVASVAFGFPIPTDVSANVISKPLAIAIKSFGIPKVRVVEAKNSFKPFVPTITSSLRSNSITPMMNNIDRAKDIVRTEIEGCRLIQTLTDKTVHYSNRMCEFLDFFVNPLPNKCLICKVLGQIKCDQSHYKRRKNIETKRYIYSIYNSHSLVVRVHFTSQ